MPATLSGADRVGNILRGGTVAPPGRAFAYSSAGSDLLSAILTHATGMSGLDYARPRLFGPLGINTRNAVQPRVKDTAPIPAYDKASFGWLRNPSGIQFGFAALKMAPRDMAKLGQLCLDGGRWNGRQVVPTDWGAAGLPSHPLRLARRGPHGPPRTLQTQTKSFENTTASATGWLQVTCIATRLRHLSRERDRRCPVAFAA